jgi:hypothetical protein
MQLSVRPQKNCAWKYIYFEPYFLFHYERVFVNYEHGPTVRFLTAEATVVSSHERRRQILGAAPHSSVHLIPSFSLHLALKLFQPV